MTLGDYIAYQQKRIDAALEKWVPEVSQNPSRIHEAMRYSLFAGGKRVRPLLAIAAAEAVSESTDGVEHAACALELIHTYSLIHDDLPALDNDDLRRGRPTCHKVFGDAMAILAGDALLTLAFETLSKLQGVDADRRIQLVAELATASGTVGGMIGGQVNDIQGEGQPPTAELLDSIHRAKTGALLRASVRTGAIYAGAHEAKLAALTDFGEHIGLAFQIVDDVLDIEESSETLGKTAGKDAQQQKITFPAVYGLDRSRAMADQERTSAHAALDIFGERGGPLEGTCGSGGSTQSMKIRIDQLMVERGLVESREKAQALILAGEVLINGQKADKPGRSVADDSQIELLAKLAYVSRGGLKLERALDYFKIDVTNWTCLDVGSSTGGFTDCLLQRSARKVFAIDVGKGQLDWKLRNDARVEVREGVNARYLDVDDFPERFDLAVCDASFISVTLLIPSMIALLKEDGRMVILVKPQFEVGKGEVGKGGIVRDPVQHQSACDRVRASVEEHGFRAELTESPILGAEGNREFLLYAQRPN